MKREFCSYITGSHMPFIIWGCVVSLSTWDFHSSRHKFKRYPLAKITKNAMVGLAIYGPWVGPASHLFSDGPRAKNVILHLRWLAKNPNENAILWHVKVIWIKISVVIILLGHCYIHWFICCLWPLSCCSARVD